jgi:hypothetical protein
MEDQSRNFQEFYHKSTIFAQALNRIIMVPGDLHGGGFHFFMVVFQLFYGGFLQALNGPWMEEDTWYGCHEDI